MITVQRVKQRLREKVSRSGNQIPEHTNFLNGSLEIVRLKDITAQVLGHLNLLLSMT